MGHGEMRATVCAFQRAFRSKKREERREQERKKERRMRPRQRVGARGKKEVAGRRGGGDTRVSKDVMRERNGKNEMRCERGRGSERELMRVRSEGNEREPERECEDAMRGRKERAGSGRDGKEREAW